MSERITSFVKWYRLIIERKREIFCGIGWHKIGEYTHFDGASQHAHCEWCDYHGMIDSQGNLF